MTALAQGDLRLLESEIAQRLLASTLPARYAYTAPDGTPRIVASWFVWTGEELVMPTFVAGPHVSHAAHRVRTLRSRPQIAVSIDTDGWPPEVLSIRGGTEVTEVDGVAPEYAQAAERYLGAEVAAGMVAQIDHPSTRRRSLRDAFGAPGLAPIDSPPARSADGPIKTG